jgi:hypothetical protein
VKRLLTGECRLGIWFRSLIGSRGLGVWMDHICICDVVFVYSFVAETSPRTAVGWRPVVRERSSQKGGERLNNWFEVESGMRSITATR